MFKNIDDVINLDIASNRTMLELKFYSIAGRGYGPKNF